MNAIHKSRESRQVYEWDGDTRLKIFVLKSPDYQSYISSSFKTKSWELCSVWRLAKLNNVRPDDDKDDDDNDDDEEDDDYGGGDGVGNSVTYEW